MLFHKSLYNEVRKQIRSVFDEKTNLNVGNATNNAFSK